MRPEPAQQSRGVTAERSADPDRDRQGAVRRARRAASPGERLHCPSSAAAAAPAGPAVSERMP